MLCCFSHWQRAGAVAVAVAQLEKLLWKIRKWWRCFERKAFLSPLFYSKHTVRSLLLPLWLRSRVYEFLLFLFVCTTFTIPSCHMVSNMQQKKNVANGEKKYETDKFFNKSLTWIIHCCGLLFIRCIFHSGRVRLLVGSFRLFHLWFVKCAKMKVIFLVCVRALSGAAYVWLIFPY